MTKSGNILYLDEYRQDLKPIETRVLWGDFPPVFIFTPLGTAKKHKHYEKAKKECNANSAIQLVHDIVEEEKLEELRGIINSNKPIVVPVQAKEEFGVNKIPAAFAYYIATKLGFELCDNIVVAICP